MRLLLNLMREVTRWDRPTQIALAIAIVLLTIDLTILSTQDELQNPALIGAVGLILTIQAIFLWGNRNLVTPITDAQRKMIAGDFSAAIDVLLTYLKDEAKPDSNAYVLLGNSYRNLGQLDESERWLQQALSRHVDDHFALYGLGKTALAKGDYQYAIDHFEESLVHGGYQTAQFDIGLAYFLMDDVHRAFHHLQQMPEHDDINRQLFAAYIAGQAEPDMQSVDAYSDGLAFWRAEVKRFRHTPYGKAIAQHMSTIEKML